MLSKNGEIRRDEACLDISGDKVVIQNCHGGLGNQQWKYTDVRFISDFSVYELFKLYFVTL